jgi:hypothetical protein
MSAMEVRRPSHPASLEDDRDASDVNFGMQKDRTRMFFRIGVSTPEAI